MNSLFFNFFFFIIFFLQQYYTIHLYKKYMHRKIYLSFKSKLTDIYFLTVVPTESNKVFHFFILKKNNKPKQLKHQLIS